MTTLFLDFRTQNVGGSSVRPTLWSGDGTQKPLSMLVRKLEEYPGIFNGKNVLFFSHGFNVSREYGACSLGRLESLLGLTPADVFVGVLWPGDFWIPAINYPFEGSDAISCGKFLAEFCNKSIPGAQSLSFGSHSLGARVVLEAVKNLRQKARVVCLTAAAINRDCLDTEYSAAAANATSISILASHGDAVLKYAFSIGDPISDLLHADHTPFQPALGYDGPPVPARQPVTSPWQIADTPAYGHGDYLPPGKVPAPAPPPNPLWPKPAGFIGRAFRRENQTWP